MIRAAVLAALLALPAAADNLADIRGSEVWLEETTEPGAVLALVFRNIQVNRPSDTGQEWVIDLNGISVRVRFIWNDGGSADTVLIEVPPGYIARPDRLTVEEETDGTALIYPMQKEMM